VELGALTSIFVGNRGGRKGFS